MVSRCVRAGRAALAALATALTLAAQAGGFQDPLALPAQRSELAARSLLQGVARAGERLVAVGQRGHIVHSSDGGRSWLQAEVPVSSDLTALCFVNSRLGWAVGHDGVVLHTVDGGLHWELQLDGRRANELLVASMEQRSQGAAATPGSRQLLDEARRFREQGADKPFLALWFANAREGFVVGAYNLIFRTVDGGRSWEPWFDRTDNPKLFNFYAIAAVGSELYLAGEAGLLLKLDAAAQRFVALPVPYQGSFFGALGLKGSLLVYGLRGHAYRSDDGGRGWEPVETGLMGSIVAAATRADGSVVLADASGRLAVSDAAGRRFQLAPIKPAMPLTGLVDAGDGRLALVGLRGAALSEALPR